MWGLGLGLCSSGSRRLVCKIHLISTLQCIDKCGRDMCMVVASPAQSKSGGWLLKVPVFARVRNVVDLVTFNVWSMKCIALLCMTILSPLISWFVHAESR